MATFENFLNPGVEQLRQSIKDIDDSYNNEWDIIAELCQNSVDAIRKMSDSHIGNINIEIDAITKTIAISDNGIGINSESLPTLLKPFSTNKRTDDNSIGEKGVGLTFVMFSSNHFEIITSNSGITSKGLVLDAYNWKSSNTTEGIKLEIEQVKEEFIGTTIKLKDVSDCPLFDLKFGQLKFVLRTKTALGNTKCIWEDDIDIKIHVSFIDKNGLEHNDDLPFRYWLPHENLSPQMKIDLNEFKSFAQLADKTDIEKRNKLKSKIIYFKGEYQHTDNRIIKYVTYFVPKRKVWNDLSSQFNFASADDLDDERWIENFGYSILGNGIFTSVKGMPTGISIDHPNTGYSGYWSNIFILFEDRSLKFDIGRKSMHGRQSSILKEYARQIFSEYLKYVTKYVSGEVYRETEWDRERIFADIDSLIDLNINGIKLSKTPREQEASVAALFYECIGNGKISSITPLTSGYKNKYDLYAKWGHKKIIIEFKAKLKNVLKDFNDEQKMFDELNCIVCWNVDEEDQQVFSNKGIDLEEIERSPWDSEDQYLPEATHRLVLSGFIKPLMVIDLKKFLKA